MLGFIDAYTLWRRHPFPRSSTEEALSALHGDIALADHYVTTVIPFAEQGVFQPAVPDVMSLLADIQRRLQDIINRESDEPLSIAREQHAYAALLQLVYEQFLAVGGQAD